MRDLEVGDKARISERLKEGVDHYIVPEMRDFEGDVAEIVEVKEGTECEYYKLDIDNQMYGWEKSMFSEIVKEQPRFEEGDRVKIREDLEPGEHHDGLYFHPRMQEFRGEVVEVIGFNSVGRYILDIDSAQEWVFNDAMVKKVDTKQEQKKEKLRKAIESSTEKWKMIDDWYTNDKKTQHTIRHEMGTPCGFCEQYTCSSCPVEDACAEIDNDNSISLVIDIVFDALNTQRRKLGMGEITRLKEQMNTYGIEVGDKVRIVDNTEPAHCCSIGDTCVVESFDGDEFVEIHRKWDGMYQTVNINDIEPIDSKFKEGDLVTGTEKSNEKYNITTPNMKVARVVSTGRKNMKIKVLVHKNKNDEGKKFDVINDRDYFEEVNLD